MKMRAWLIESLEAKIEAKTNYIIELEAKNKAMLEALKLLVEMQDDPIRFCGCSGERYDIAKTAIAKAKGN
jgi:hypothetical protein